MKSIHIICVFQETKWLCCKGSRKQFERNVFVSRAVWTTQVLRACRGNYSQNPVSEWLFLFKSFYYIIYMYIIMLKLNRKLTWKRPSGIDSVMSDSSLKLTCLLFIWVQRFQQISWGFIAAQAVKGNQGISRTCQRYLWKDWTVRQWWATSFWHKARTKCRGISRGP